MSAKYPAIEEWERLGLKWLYIWNPKFTVLTIPARGQVQVPYEGYAYKYPEGIIIFYSAAFDHPSCGVRFQWHPECDSGNLFTVTNILIGGMTRPEELAYGIAPPDSPWYSIRVCSAWKWEQWLNLYVINTDSVPHRCFGFAYMLAVLQEPRKKPLPILL